MGKFSNVYPMLQQVRTLAAGGMTTKAACEQVGITQAQYYANCKRFGLELVLRDPLPPPVEEAYPIRTALAEGTEGGDGQRTTGEGCNGLVAPPQADVARMLDAALPPMAGEPPRQRMRIATLRGEWLSCTVEGDDVHVRWVRPKQGDAPGINKVPLAALAEIAAELAEAHARLGGGR